MSKTFFFGDRHVVISRIDAVYRTLVYTGVDDCSDSRDRYIDVVLVLNGSVLTETFYCGRKAYPADRDYVAASTAYEKTEAAAMAATKAREQEILRYIDAGCVPKKQVRKRVKK